jgi:uncharacterized protein YjbI with pentapeptide repeats
MFSRIRRLLRPIKHVVAGVARVAWSAVSRIPRRWGDVVVVLAASGLAAILIVQSTADTDQIVALVALGALVVVLGFWRIPKWQADGALNHPDNKKSRFELENEARKTLGEALSGLFLVVGLAVTWQQLASDRKDQQDTANQVATEQAMTQHGQVTERFTDAMNQLGSDKLRVRIGAVHALDQLAQDSADYVPVVVEVLAAFVRERSPWPIPSGSPTPIPDKDGRILPPADVQEALLVMGRGQWVTTSEEPTGAVDQQDAHEPARDVIANDPPLAKLTCINLNRTDLRGTNLEGSFPIPLCVEYANLEGAIFSKVVLTDAKLLGSDLSDVDLGVADLTSADLRNVDLSDADLGDADLTMVISGGIIGKPLRLPEMWKLVAGFLIGPESDLDGADLHGAHLERVDLRSSSLYRADLRSSLLIGADLTDANLDFANLSDANLRGAVLFRTALYNVHLKSADLSGTIMTGADLSFADLAFADLTNADLTFADLRFADLSGANLSGADLSRARDLTQAQVDSAITDSNTRLPSGLHLPATPSPAPSGTPSPVASPTAFSWSRQEHDA